MDKRTRFLILILFILGNLVFYNPVFATPVGTGKADYYVVTLNKFELENAEGTQFAAFEGASSPLDIAAADIGCFAGTFTSGLVIPDGNYTKVKPTPSGTFTVRGSVVYDAGGGNQTYYTTSEIGSGGGCVTNNVGPAQNCTVTVPITGLVWIDLPSTVTITDGKCNYKIRVKFNTSNAVGLWIVGAHFEITPEAPVLSVELIPQ